MEPSNIGTVPSCTCIVDGSIRFLFDASEGERRLDPITHSVLLLPPKGRRGGREVEISDILEANSVRAGGAASAGNAREDAELLEVEATGAVSGTNASGK